MTEYICKEVQTDNGGYLEPVNELIRCKDCKYWKLLENSETIGTCWMYARYPLAESFCDKAERKEE